jgi:hypothetical protein
MPAVPADGEGAKRVRALDPTQRTFLGGELGRLLDAQRARIEYTEGRRGSMATAFGVVLTVGFAGLIAVSTASWSYFPTKVALLCITIALSLLGVWGLLVYARQTNWDYPFKAGSSTWKHFYRDAINDRGPNRVRVPWHLYQSKKAKAVATTLWDAAEPTFIDRTLSLADDTVSIAQDIEQVYLLHWNEMYKNRFLTQLRTVLVRGIAVSALAGILGFAAAWHWAPHFYSKASASPTTIAKPWSQRRYGGRPHDHR